MSRCVCAEQPIPRAGDTGQAGRGGRQAMTADPDESTPAERRAAMRWAQRLKRSARGTSLYRTRSGSLRPCKSVLLPIRRDRYRGLTGLLRGDADHRVHRGLTRWQCQWHCRCHPWRDVSGFATPQPGLTALGNSAPLVRPAQTIPGLRVRSSPMAGRSPAGSGAKSSSMKKRFRCSAGCGPGAVRRERTPCWRRRVYRTR